MKKILAHLSDNIAGFRQPCVDIGHEWIWWEDGIPAFDAFDIHKPDIAFIDHSMINGALIKRLREYEKPLPLVIAQEVGNELFFHYANQLLPKAFHGVSTHAAVDTFAFYEQKPDGIEPPGCRLTVVCDHDKAPELKPFLFPVNKYKIRIYGPYWPNTVQYVGGISMDDMRMLYSSSPMSYATSPKEAVRIVACGGLSVSLNESVAVLGEGFVVSEDRLKELLECDGCDSTMLEQQREAVFPNLTYNNILTRLIDKGLEL